MRAAFNRSAAVNGNSTSCSAVHTSRLHIKMRAMVKAICIDGHAGTVWAVRRPSATTTPPRAPAPTHCPPTDAVPTALQEVFVDWASHLLVALKAAATQGSVLLNSSVCGAVQVRYRCRGGASEREGPAPRGGREAGAGAGAGAGWGQ